MTTQSEIINDSNYIPVLDHGFCGLVEFMGSDEAIVRAARVSYGEGTKTVSENRGLIRYLLRHRHTSPIEQCVVKFHIKIPIFVARQLIRHRTASLNEYSGRYSIMPDEFYIPADDAIKPQSVANKQGRDGDIDQQSKAGVQWLIKAASETNYEIYKILLGETWNNAPYDPYDKESPLLDMSFPGIARELARTVLPLNNYTELYWTQNLHNLFHLLKLRMDTHSQHEIRIVADALYQLIKPKFPLACEAFEDYVNQARILSRMECALMASLLVDSGSLRERIAAVGGLAKFGEAYGMSKREIRDFAETWELSAALPAS